MDKPNPLEVAEKQSAALLDNTTVTGAAITLQRPTEASIADEQSLADIVEAVVLHESLVADSWFGLEGYPDPLLNLREKVGTSGDGSPIFTAYPSVAAVMLGAEDVEEPGTAPPMEFMTGLVGEALDRLERGLRSDELARQQDLLTEQLRAGQMISPLYGEPRDLRQEIIELYGDYRVHLMLDNDEAELRSIRLLEDKVAERLNGASKDRKLYAMFLLRAFYYEELAATFSLSYVPHTFRAQALLAIPRPRGGPLPGAFIEYATELAGASRAELGQRLGFDVSIDFPPIAARIARDVESRGELLPAALELRASESARAFRSWVADQERLLQAEGNLLSTERAKDELAEIVRELGVQLLGNKREGGHPITLKLTAGMSPVGPSGEASSEVMLRAPSWLRRVLRRRRPYLTFFSELTRDLITGSVMPFSKRLRQLPL
jgi:hypothetical protein